ncbi:MAG TPA: glycosyltransferase family 1 protein [Lichenihabitans sp.]|jgi:glycosyltransferase involved in cell wall biosynthesis|nr:glycosyltransferase family 1 protein [Lichenihabitans sp.]
MNLPLRSPWDVTHQTSLQGLGVHARQRVWTINGDFVGFEATGVARHGREVVAAMDALIDEGHPLTEGLALRMLVPRLPSGFIPLRHVEADVLPEWRPRLPQVWVQLQLPRHVSGGLVSFGNLAPIGATRHIACVHDAQTFVVPDSYSRMFRAAHRLILPRLGRSAAVITTVSHHSKEQLTRLGIARPDKVAVVPNGADHVRRWNPLRASRDWRRPRPFALGLARSQAHKNPELFARLAEPLDRLGVDLVLFGDVDRAVFGEDAGARLRNLHLVGRLGDDDVAAALGQALCFLLPSRTEGFGLPAVEAMALGCPVLASSAPALPEVCGDAALYADPDDVDGWVAAVQGLARDEPRRAELVARGRARAALFSWRRTAEAYLRLMARIDERDDDGHTGRDP